MCIAIKLNIVFAAVGKSGIVETLLSWADYKQSKELKKTDGAKKQNITGIPKLNDANDAGGRNSEKCTLILTEGDSAKALAVSVFICLMICFSVRIAHRIQSIMCSLSIRVGGWHL